MSTSVLDIVLSMLFNLLLANKRILYFLFLFLAVFKRLSVFVVTENTRLKVSLAIPIGAPIIVTKESIAADKR